MFGAITGVAYGIGKTIVLLSVCGFVAFFLFVLLAVVVTIEWISDGVC